MCKTSLCVLICFILIFIISPSIFPQELSYSYKKVIFNYVFLIDTSGSMAGRVPGSVNIFPVVKRTIKDFIMDIEPPANIYIFPFDRGLHDQRIFNITSRSELTQVQNFIDSLRAEGRETWLYRSLKYTLDIAENVKRNSKNEENIFVIYIFTDGLDNDRMCPYTLESIIEQFRLVRGDYDWIFYVTLGIDLPNRDIKVIRSTQYIKLIEEPRGSVHPILLIKNKILVLDYGNLWSTGKGKMTALFTIHNRERLPENLLIRIEPEFTGFPKGCGINVQPSEFKPSETIDLLMSLVNFKHDVKDCRGTYRVKFKLTTNNPYVFVVPDYISVIFKYEPPPPIPLWKKLIMGIIFLIVLYGLGILIYCYFTGESLSLWPWGGKGPNISLSFEIIEPKNRIGEIVDFSQKLLKQKEIRIGQSGEYFQDANSSFILKKGKEGNNIYINLVVEKGDVYLKRPEELSEKRILEEKIFDGDIIRFDNYKIRVSSYSLIREMG